MWPAWPMCGNVCAITCRAADAAVVPLTLICLQFCMRCFGGRVVHCHVEGTPGGLKLNHIIINNKTINDP